MKKYFRIYKRHDGIFFAKKRVCLFFWKKVTEEWYDEFMGELLSYKQLIIFDNPQDLAGYLDYRYYDSRNPPKPTLEHYHIIE